MPCPEKSKSWYDEDMLAAMESVKNRTSVKKAAADFNVPKSTLGDRINSWIQHGVKSGPETVLSKDDEEKLAAYL